MKILVFSDVHGNLPALEIMLKHAAKVDRYICLGDNVNYGPWSEECVQLVNSLHNCITIMGNHESDFIHGEYRGTNPLPKQFFDTCFPKFKRFDLLQNLAKEHWEGNYKFVHTIENKNIYPDTKVDLNENIFIGHSHHQFQLHSNGFRLFNVGSVGQNRKYIDQICYAIFYPLKEKVVFQQVIYNVDIVLKEMQRQAYPQACMDYYFYKKRITNQALIKP